jgi:hypothetical protein
MTKFCRLSHRHVPLLSPYSVVFCRPSVKPSECNHQKTNTLQNTTQNCDQKSTPNSLFQNILLISPLVSRFCLDRRWYGHTNFNGMNILQNAKKKCGGGYINENEKGGPREAALPTARPDHKTKPMNPQNDMNDTDEAKELTDHRTWTAMPLGEGRAGSGIAGSARPARGSECHPVSRSCGQLLHGRRLPWKTARQFQQAVPD